MLHSPRRLYAHLPAAIVLSALAACDGGGGELQAARDAIAADLPAPYFEDLVTESAMLEGQSLVLLVRSPEGDADRTREHPQFELLRQTEQDEMRTLCSHPALARLAGGDAVLVRRFVDRHGKIFFETTFPARDCAPPAED